MSTAPSSEHIYGLVFVYPLFRSKDLFCFHRWEGSQKLDSDQPVLWSRHETMDTAPLGQEAFTLHTTRTTTARDTWTVLRPIHNRVGWVCELLSTDPKRGPQSPQKVSKPWFGGTCWSTHTDPILTLWAQGSPPYCGSTQSYPVDPTSANRAIIYFSSKKCKLG